MFFFKLKILFSRIIGYDKPLRIGLLKYLTLKFKTFLPHYETIFVLGCISFGTWCSNLSIIALKNTKKELKNIQT